MPLGPWTCARCQHRVTITWMPEQKVWLLVHIEKQPWCEDRVIAGERISARTT